MNHGVNVVNQPQLRMQIFLQRNFYKGKTLTLFRMGIFGAGHGWGGGRGGGAKYPLPKIRQTYPTMITLGSYTLPKEDPKNL